MNQDIIVSGMRPTGKLHLGHLNGVLDNWVELQGEAQCYFFVANWHALTTEYQNPALICKFSYEMIVDWLSMGIDPEKATVFIQSEVPEHAELHLLFSMITPISWLERVPSYKELKNELKDRDLSTYGFLGYPLLQAADVAIYQATHVPVGQDQVAHLELAREVIRRFNFLYKKAIFVECQSLLTRASKLLGLDGRKMSKSYDNCIYLSDDDKTIDQKLKTSVTDPARVRRTDPGNPEICPVYGYHKIYSTSEEISEIAQECRSAGIGCIDCKKKVSSNIKMLLKPSWERRKQFQKDPNFVKDLLSQGAKKASRAAKENLKLAYAAMKLD